MPLTRRSAGLGLSSTLLAPWVVASAARAQTPAWPDKPVRVIVNFAPGGGTDNAFRPFTEPLLRALGQPIVLDHKGGASGAIGIEAATKARPDGYTFLASPSPSVVILPQVRKVTWDAGKDLVPVAALSWYPMFLSVHPSVPVNNLQELVAFGKANPAKLSLASSGMGSTGHMLLEALNRAAGLSILHVPYRGSAEALNDFLAGVVQIFADPTVAPHVKAGKARLIAVTGPQRHPEYPAVPSLSEVYDGANFVSWNAIFAPTGTPDPIIQRFAQAIDAIAKTPEIAATLLNVGQFPLGGTPDALGQRMRADTERFRQLIQALGIKPE
jgi:tripartite-type tricarboxylate transporter receptor subunit TctC